MSRASSSASALAPSSAAASALFLLFAGTFPLGPRLASARLFASTDGARELIKELPTCERVLPVLHDLSPSVVEEYDRMVRWDKVAFDGYELPALISLEGAYFRTTVSEKNWPARSMAWTEDGAYVEEDASIPRDRCHELGEGVWADPPTDPALREAERTLEGDYVAFSGWYRGNFGHFVHDHVPVIAWLRSQVPAGTKLLLPHHDLHEQVLTVVDADFVQERVEWIRYDETVRVGGRLTVAVPKLNDPFPCGFPQTASVFTEHLRAWLEESTKADAHTAADGEGTKRVIYYTRAGGTARRLVEPHLEERIVQTIRESMVQYGRSAEELIVFNGKEESGETMSVRRQFELFRVADTVIGPHGSGLTNVIWMDPRARPCGSRPKILEFASSRRTPTVQNGSFSAYWFLFGSMPWMDYHHLYYTEQSDAQTTYVDLPALEEALHAMWGGEEDAQS